VVSACQKKGANAIPLVCDVNDRAAMTKALSEMDDAHQFDLIVANAGVSGGVVSTEAKKEGVDEVPLEKRQTTVFETNIFGVLNTVLPLLERFRTRGRGQLAVVSSIAGLFNQPRSMAYSASKACLISYCRDLRAVMRHHGVSVVTVCPGFVRSAMTDVNTREGYKMPFFMETDKAVKTIMGGLAADVGVVAFPHIMYLITYVITCLPHWVQDKIVLLSGIGKKVQWSKVG